jgi:hypothetical protein
MTDPFLNLTRPVRSPQPREVRTGHETRKHSKFSASGAERWFECPGSVELSEGLPDKSSPYAEEGTRAHEVLEELLKAAIALGATKIGHVSFAKSIPREMAMYCVHAANRILGVWANHPGSEILVETKIDLAFIHPEAFGTFDGAVIDHFGTLHVFDFKYGAGHAVSVRENLQMIFYGLGLAFRYHWNFKRVRLWIIQPRIKGYDGPIWWELPMPVLKEYVRHFLDAVRRVERMPDRYVEGSWCHWCKAKSKCPLKLQAKLNAAKTIFTVIPVK